MENSRRFTKGTIFSAAQPPLGEQLPSNWVTAILVARDGTLWIGTEKGLASWKDGKLTEYPEVAGSVVTSLLRGDGC